MQDTTLSDQPTSFGTFKPTGHVLVALKTRNQLDTLRSALGEAGWRDDAVAEFTPHDTIEDLQARVDNASGLAGFGYEITLMRRYLQLAREGHSYLLVKVDNDEQSDKLASLARLYGATAAVHYRTFTVEDLI